MPTIPNTPESRASRMLSLAHRCDVRADTLANRAGVLRRAARPMPLRSDDGLRPNPVRIDGMREAHELDARANSSAVRGARIRASRLSLLDEARRSRRNLIVRALTNSRDSRRASSPLPPDVRPVLIVGPRFNAESASLTLRRSAVESPITRDTNRGRLDIHTRDDAHRRPSYGRSAVRFRAELSTRVDAREVRFNGRTEWTPGGLSVVCRLGRDSGPAVRSGDGRRVRYRRYLVGFLIHSGGGPAHPFVGRVVSCSTMGAARDWADFVAREWQDTEADRLVSRMATDCPCCASVAPCPCGAEDDPCASDVAIGGWAEGLPAVLVSTMGRTHGRQIETIVSDPDTARQAIRDARAMLETASASRSRVAGRVYGYPAAAFPDGRLIVGCKRFKASAVNALLNPPVASL